MPIIKIYDLHPIAAKLVYDTESYMQKLGKGEFEVIHSGSTIRCRTDVSRARKASYEKPKSFGYRHSPKL